MDLFIKDVADIATAFIFILIITDISFVNAK